jgi:hypothetical protein
VEGGEWGTCEEDVGNSLKLEALLAEYIIAFLITDVAMVAVAVRTAAMSCHVKPIETKKKDTDLEDRLVSEWCKSGKMVNVDRVGSDPDPVFWVVMTAARVFILGDKWVTEKSLDESRF